MPRSGLDPGAPRADLIVAMTDPVIDVGSGDAADLLISLDAELSLSQGRRTWKFDGAPVLEIAFHLAGWDGRSRLAVGSMTYEADPIFILSRHEEAMRIDIADGTTFETSASAGAATVASFIAEVDLVARELLDTSVAELRAALLTPPRHRRRSTWPRRGREA